jgi:hypothetical protein
MNNVTIEVTNNNNNNNIEIPAGRNFTQKEAQ